MSDHHQAAQIRCDRIECLRLSICYGYSHIDGLRICHECYRMERETAS